MVAVGVDYGTGRVAFAAPSAGSWLDIVLQPKEPLVSIDVIAEAAYNHFMEVKASVVVIEAPIVGASRNMRVGVSMGMVAGAIWIVAGQCGAERLLVEPARWKKAVIGVGNADKQQVAQWLLVRHPEWHARCSSQDAIDATCMALYPLGCVG